MKFGMNLLLWADDLQEDMLPLLENLKEMGFDGVEVPVLTSKSTNGKPGPNAWTISVWRERQ